ncbi:hypothetical protein BC830DRAFT_1118908 [Chytriomyces sp. MP71]|nr:hypothetical protein BC830DRAFT_1118908 [Chytriomyces sp. MP71]
MLPIVAPDLAISTGLVALPSVDKRRPSTGHIQLLATYADIMSEIDDLVPEDALSPSAMAESAILMKAERSMSASAVHMEGLLGRLKSPSVSPVPGSGAVTPKRRLTPMQSELSILAAYGDQASADTMLKDGIEAWDAEEEEIDDESDEEVEFVIEEYFVKHRAPTLIAGEGEMSSGSDSEEENDERNGTPKPRRLDSSASKFTIGVYANDAAAGDADTIADSIKTTDPMPGDADTVVSAVGHDPALSIARTDIAPNSEFLVPSPATPLEEYSDTNDDDEERAIVPSHMIVSKVTRVVTVNKDNVVRGVQVHVEPLGTVASSGNIPAAHRLRHTLSALNLKDGSAPNAAVSSSPASPKPASPSPVSASKVPQSPKLVRERLGTGVQRRLKTEDGRSKPVIKRRSGLSTFLQFLANH